MKHSTFATLVVLFTLSACSAQTELAVDLRTDLVPAVEFDEVLLTVEGAGGDVSRTVPVNIARDFTRAVRIAELRPIEPGLWMLRAELRKGGAVVTTRDVAVRLLRSQVVVVVVTRNCRGVACTSGATCFSAQCVDPMCSTTDGGSCGMTPACRLDTDCPARPGCVRPRCVQGACLTFPDESLCSATDYCEPDTGACRAIPPELMLSDLGVPAPADMGVDAEATDLGPQPDLGPLPDLGAPVVDAGACVTAASCPAMQTGAWGACAGFDGLCDTTGTESRSVTTYACVGGRCVPSSMVQTQSCMRPTEGTSCGTSVPGPWGACGRFTGQCDEVGSETRSVTTFTCRSESCVMGTTSETQPCMRMTEGFDCTEAGGNCGIASCVGGACVASVTRDCVGAEFCCQPGRCIRNTMICNIE